MLSRNNLFTSAIIFITLFQSACSTLTQHKSEINIIDVRNNKEPEVNLAAHKHGDVEVFRIVFLGEGYKVRYYQNENGTLNHHEALFMNNEDFDRASYKRVSDTSIAMRLFNSATKKEKKFEVFGNGSTSGIRD